MAPATMARSSLVMSLDCAVFGIVPQGVPLGVGLATGLPCWIVMPISSNSLASWAFGEARFHSFWTHLSIKQLYYVVIDDCYSPIISVELMVTVNPNKPSPKSPLQSTLWARLWCSQQIEASPGAALWKAPFLKMGNSPKTMGFQKKNGPMTWGYWLWKPPKMWKSISKPWFLRDV